MGNDVSPNLEQSDHQVGELNNTRNNNSNCSTSGRKNVLHCHSSGFKDAALDAVAVVEAGNLRRHQTSQIPLPNEWKKSLWRLGKTATSTANAMANAAVPAVTDAKKVVVSSVIEFANDVQKEWERGNEIQFMNDEEKATICSISDRSSVRGDIHVDQYPMKSRINSVHTSQSSLANIDDNSDESNDEFINDTKYGAVDTSMYVPKVDITPIDHEIKGADTILSYTICERAQEFKVTKYSGEHINIRSDSLNRTHNNAVNSEIKMVCPRTEIMNDAYQTENETITKDFDINSTIEISIYKEDIAKQAKERAHRESNQCRSSLNEIENNFDVQDFVDKCNQSNSIPPSVIAEKIQPTKCIKDERTNEFDNIKSSSCLSDKNKINKKLLLFDANESSIYRNKESNITSVTGNLFSKLEDKFYEYTRSRQQPEHGGCLPKFEKNTFANGKKIKRCIVSNLSRFDIEIKDQNLSTDYPFPKSIFDEQRTCLSAASSLSLPSDTPTCDEIRNRYSDRFSKDEVIDDISMFDLFPARREILSKPETDWDSIKLGSFVSKENHRHRAHNNLLDSMCAQQNSSNSIPFSTSSRIKNRRRLRKQGSRLSLNSLIDTKSSKSPYEIPIENCSLVDGKEVDMDSADLGVQLVRWDSNAEASVLSTDEMTDAIEKSEFFHETLVAFSSLEHLKFLENFSFTKSKIEVPKSVATILWRQLVSSWKHSQTFKAMLTKLSSIHLSNLTGHRGSFEKDTSSSTTSSIHFQLHSKNISFSNDFVARDAYSSLRCIQDECCVRPSDDFLIFTGFLCNIGPPPYLHESVPLRHDICVYHKKSGQHGGDLSVEAVQKEAKSLLSDFEFLIKQIACYSTQNDLACTDFERYGLSFSVGVKNSCSIEEKATRKYNGDISQVKDVLRGELTFPDEGSLICGLHFLHTQAKRNEEKAGMINSILFFQIVRLKNLFYTNKAGNLLYDTLPTGYRHILVNLKLNEGFIAEIQFQLASAYKVLGAEGYSLHREIASFEAEKFKKSMDQNINMKVPELKRDYLLSVSTSSDFVHSILTSSARINMASSVVSKVNRIHVMKESTMDTVKSSANKQNTKGAKALGFTSTEENECFDEERLNMLISAIFEIGKLEVRSNPRCVPAFYCLHLLATCIQQRCKIQPTTREETAVTSKVPFLSKRLLLRILAISNQAASISMIGWLEYGSSDPFDRALDLHIEALRQLSYNMAAENDWVKASDVLSSLLIKCERDLPLCHPTTISAMLDFACSLMHINRNDTAKFIITELLDRFTKYLSEVESLFFDKLYCEVSYENSSIENIVLDDCVDAINMIQAFGTKFLSELSRDFLKLLGPDHRICLLNHSLVADSLSVLANCLACRESIRDENIVEPKISCISNEHETVNSRFFWSLAYSHYNFALKGWTELESLIHPNAAGVILSIARCLRQLGKSTQALRVLEMLSSCLEQQLYKISATVKSIFPGSNHVRLLSPFDTVSFLPRLASPSHRLISYEREQTTVVCLWMMAGLTVELSPDERGRGRATSLLHTASLTLQRIMKENGKSLDDHTRMIFLDLYNRIEREALDLFEPVRTTYTTRTSRNHNADVKATSA